MKHIDIALINPLDPRAEARGIYKTSRIPLGLMSLAASTGKAGFAAEIIDSQALEHNAAESARLALETGANIIGITSTTCSFNQARDIASQIKAVDPAITVIMGGHHVTALPEHSLQTCQADIVVIGEGEEVLPELIKRIQRQERLDDIGGICYRDGDNIKINKQILFIANLDTLPLPDRNLIDYKLYSDAPRGIYEPQDALEGSRGCAYKCGFCVAGRRRLRFKSVDRMIEEIKIINFQHQVNNIIMMDDTFTLDRKRTINFCQRVIDEGLKIKFACQTRFDKVDKEILHWLEKAGCTAACFGVESGNKEIIKSIGKNLDLDEVLCRAPLLKNFSFKTRCTFILGWIDETYKQMRETIDFAIAIDADETAFCVATPFPGSAMWDYAIAKKRLSPDIDFDRFIYYHKIGCNLSKVPDHKLLDIQKDAYKRCKSKSYNETMTFSLS